MSAISVQVIAGFPLKEFTVSSCLPFHTPHTLLLSIQGYLQDVGVLNFTISYPNLVRELVDIP